MTNKEAINELKEASDSEVRYGDIKHHHDEVMKRVAAFDMAIKALEIQACKPDGDDWESYADRLYELAYQHGQGDKEPCEDWKFYYNHGYAQAKRDLAREVCDDCISREAVDEYITNLLSGYLYDEERTRLEDLTAYIWELPSVQPTRTTGKWETFVEDYNKCSKCGEMGKFYRIYKYCPNCGARMTESEDKDADSN